MGPERPLLPPASLGLCAVGLDINPAMTLIAKARLADRASFTRLRKIVEQLRSSDLSFPRHTPQTLQAETLTQWFDAPTAVALRALEKRLGLAPREHSLPTYVESLSRSESFRYVVFFKLVRRLTTSFEASNPTWVRVAQITGGTNPLFTQRTLDGIARRSR